MTEFTIIGGQGFIGNALGLHLKKMNKDFVAPDKNDNQIFSKSLGTIFYCAGHGDCDKNPLKVVDSNLTFLSHILSNCEFKRLIYLSSTRLYLNQPSSNENANIQIDAHDGRRLFNLSKLAAEELCKKSGRDCKSLRLSNVYGTALNSPLFLPAITRDAILKRTVNMFVSPGYAKDYVSINDVVDSCLTISGIADKSFSIFNIASGINTKAEDIANIIEKETNAKINWHEHSINEDKFPTIEIDKIANISDYTPRNVLKDLSEMISTFKRELIN